MNNITVYSVRFQTLLGRFPKYAEYNDFNPLLEWVSNEETLLIAELHVNIRDLDIIFNAKLRKNRDVREIEFSSQKIKLPQDIKKQVLDILEPYMNGWTIV